MHDAQARARDFKKYLTENGRGNMVDGPFLATLATVVYATDEEYETMKTAGDFDEVFETVINRTAVDLEIDD